MTRLLAIIHPHWFSILWLGVILVVTLVPLEATGKKPSILCVLCGDGAVADGVLNAVLFLPLGAALSVARWHRLGALALGAILSCGVETAQFAILGRDPSLSDLLSNTLGTALGIALVSSVSTWWRPGRRMAQVLSVSAAIGTAFVFVLSGILLRPSFPDETYYGGWTPRSAATAAPPRRRSSRIFSRASCSTRSGSDGRSSAPPTNSFAYSSSLS